MGNLDYLAARLHGRRSGMAEGDKLEALARIRTLPDFARSLFPDSEFRSLPDLQRRLVEELAQEMTRFSADLNKTQVPLVHWMLKRFDVENLKILLRASIRKITPEETIEHLVVTPGQKASLIHALSVAGSVSDFVRFIPEGPIKTSLEKEVLEHGEEVRPFFLEAALDRGYYSELLSRFSLLSRRDQDETASLVRQEADMFHVMLVLRGRFNYGLAADQLASMHVPGTAINKDNFSKMLNDPDPLTAVNRVVMRVFDPLPFDKGSGDLSIPVATFESLAWRRYLRLANTTFRRSHMGFGVVVGYVALRRVEIANLITISEGIRMGLDTETIKARMLPRSNLEAAYV
ncbi:MAG: V0D/AC39 family V-type ATPase subunit [Syntrophorhabdaceae bacterium]